MDWRASRELKIWVTLSAWTSGDYNGYVLGDTARTGRWRCGLAAQRLMDVTEKALYEGLPGGSGNPGGDIIACRAELR